MLLGDLFFTGGGYGKNHFRPEEYDCLKLGPCCRVCSGNEQPAFSQFTVDKTNL